MSRENWILLFVLAALALHQIWMGQRIEAISAGLHDLGTEQVAAFLGVTPDTVRDSYIPRWIKDGHMSEADKAANRWRIPPEFQPYKP